MRVLAFLAMTVLAGCSEDAAAPTSASTLRPQTTPASCLARRPEAWNWTPDQRWRHRELWSDSLWLINQVRQRHGGRLAGVRLEVGRTAAEARLVFRLTADEPIAPMRLRDRARAVPVVVEYGAPHSLHEVDAIRARVHDRAIALLPSLQGVGYDETTGTMHLDVQAADGRAAAKVLARCDELARLYGMPVRITPNANVIAEAEREGAGRLRRPESSGG